MKFSLIVRIQKSLTKKIKEDDLQCTFVTAWMNWVLTLEISVGCSQSFMVWLLCLILFCTVKDLTISLVSWAADSLWPKFSRRSKNMGIGLCSLSWVPRKSIKGLWFCWWSLEYIRWTPQLLISSKIVLSYRGAAKEAWIDWSDTCPEYQS